MPNLEVTNEAETEVEIFTDELSDEALDREQGGDAVRSCAFCTYTKSGNR